MNTTDDLERHLRLMLADAAPRREPETLFAAVMASTRTIRQRPSLVVELRQGGIGAATRSNLRLAPMLLVALLTMGLLASLSFLGGGSSTPVAPPPSPSPSPSPSLASPSASSPATVVDGEPWIVFDSDKASSPGEGTFLMRPDGTDARLIAADVTGRHKHPDWSPDGRRIVFVVEDTGSIWIVDADGSNPELVIDCANDCDYPAWSPDGTKIAYTEAESAPPTPAPIATTIKIIDLATKAITTVVREERPLLVDVPRWSPDGTQLVVGVDRMDAQANETGAAIAIVPAAGGELRYLTEFETFAYKPDWSWVTDTILYGTDVLKYKTPQEPGDDTWNLYTIKPDGTGLKQITDVPAGSRLWEASWTPDGTRIIADWESNRVGVFVDPGTGQITTINGTTVMTHPNLRPTP